MTCDLAVLYEHPNWFEPLFRALERRGIPFVPVKLDGHLFDPASSSIPAPVIFNRVAMSSFLRSAEHGIFYSQSLLSHWESNGARVVNGPAVMALDASKARQLSLISRLGLAIPATRVVHRTEDLLSAAEEMAYPLLVKANVGGSGAGIARYDSRDALASAVAERTAPVSIDSVLLVQDWAPPRRGRILRLETLGGRFLYGIEVEAGGDTFDLCPADACVAQPGRAAVSMKAVTPDERLIEAAERIVQAAGIEVGGVELLIDDRDGAPRFYDINALSNFVADPLNVLGWDPHDRLVDYLAAAIEQKASLR